MVSGHARGGWIRKATAHGGLVGCRDRGWGWVYSSTA